MCGDSIMLDISFYSTSGKAPLTIAVTENFYQWLLQGDFAEIGVARPQRFQSDHGIYAPCPFRPCGVISSATPPLLRFT
jgi:hypothetical protein